ncbi:MAG: hypothetical protein JWN80_1212 [Microbacteriaceae bacterium]|jgi:hypothetical protein|nr:hypothetical protein [Microbacteriaceae bacterium]
MSTVALIRFEADAARSSEVIAAAKDNTGPLLDWLIRIGERDWLDYEVWAADDATSTSEWLSIPLDVESGTLVDSDDAGRIDVTVGATVELTRFRTQPGHADELIAARPGMLVSFRTDRAGFLASDLVRLGDDEWLDVVFWRSSDDYAASRAQGANTPAITTYFGAIAEILSAEEGVIAA